MGISDDIESAFATSTYPGDDHLTVYDVGGRDYDETFRLLRGKHWKEMPVTEFMHGDSPIPDLTPEAFCYYLPALLTASISRDVDCNYDVAQSLMFFLSPKSASAQGEYAFDDSENYNRRMSLLTHLQRQVIARVLLEYVARGWANHHEVAAINSHLDL